DTSEVQFEQDSSETEIISETGEVELVSEKKEFDIIKENIRINNNNFSFKQLNNIFYFIYIDSRTNNLICLYYNNMKWSEFIVDRDVDSDFGFDLSVSENGYLKVLYRLENNSERIYAAVKSEGGSWSFFDFEAAVDSLEMVNVYYKDLLYAAWIESNEHGSSLYYDIIGSVNKGSQLVSRLHLNNYLVWLDDEVIKVVSSGNNPEYIEFNKTDDDWEKNAISLDYDYLNDAQKYFYDGQEMVLVKYSKRNSAFIKLIDYNNEKTYFETRYNNDLDKKLRFLQKDSDLLLFAPDFKEYFSLNYSRWENNKTPHIYKNYDILVPVPEFNGFGYILYSEDDEAIYWDDNKNNG
ncbi:MAG: hypothetical protein ACQESP_06645, partial [Candidatus Muiribacteriota bacterium]